MEATIDQAIHLAQKGKITFPEYVKMIAGVGVEKYSVNVASHIIVYEGADRKITKKLPCDILYVAETFDEKVLKGIIGAVQRKEIDYPVFIKRIAQAGVEAYDVDIKGKAVTYKGRVKSYIEPFPQAKK